MEVPQHLREGAPGRRAQDGREWDRRRKRSMAELLFRRCEEDASVWPGEGEVGAYVPDRREEPVFVDCTEGGDSE